MHSTAKRKSSEYDFWFTDLDSTVRHGKDELGYFGRDENDVIIFPEAHERIMAFTDSSRNRSVIGISNQGGIGLGYLSHEQCKRSMARTNELLDYRLRMINYCPHKPSDNCWCRKPSPGMIFAALSVLSVDVGEEHVPSLRDILFIGDRPEDQECAYRAGIDFRIASEWRTGE